MSARKRRREPNGSDLRRVVQASRTRRAGAVWFDRDGRLYGLLDDDTPLITEEMRDLRQRAVESGEVDERRHRYMMWVHLPRRERGLFGTVVTSWADDTVDFPEADASLPLYRFATRAPAGLVFTPESRFDVPGLREPRTLLFVAELRPQRDAQRRAVAAQRPDSARHRHGTTEDSSINDRSS